MNITVYTAIFGEYDKPRNDILCFTDDNQRFNHSRMSARMYKVLFHQFIHTEWSIWIDGNVFLYTDPEFLVNIAIENKCDVVTLRHHAKDCLYEEGKMCKRSNLDIHSVIDAQMDKYRKEGFPENLWLPETRILVRRRTKDVIERCNAWWSEISVGSWRDQLSFSYVFRDFKVKLLDQKQDGLLYYIKDHLRSHSMTL